MSKMVGELAERILDEADHDAKETDVRYTHGEVFSRATKSIEEVQILKELDKGIDDMEAGRVVDHKEAMCILENRFKS